MGDPNLTASMAGIDAKIEKLKEKKKKIQLRASERFVRAAIEAGLLDIEIAEEDLLKAFRDVAERFRPRGAKPAAADAHKTRSTHKVSDGAAVGHDER